MIKLSVNGATHQIDVEDETPLLWVLRDTLGLTGTKLGCGVAAYGACTVLVDGTAQRSCSLPVSAASGAQVTTIEGLSVEVLHFPLRIRLRANKPRPRQEAVGACPPIARGRARRIFFGS